jgi:hypothetical protein
MRFRFLAVGLALALALLSTGCLGSLCHKNTTSASPCCAPPCCDPCAGGATGTSFSGGPPVLYGGHTR